MASDFDIIIPCLRPEDERRLSPDDPRDEREAALAVPLDLRLSARRCGCVTTRSPLRLRRAVWLMACYFRREFGYDAVPYGHEGREMEASARAYLWVDGAVDPPFVVGACCFRWQNWTNREPCWALQWVWFHPYRRGRGLLSSAWPYFCERFGMFLVEGPVSPEMAQFLRKQEAAGLGREFGRVMKDRSQPRL